MITKQTLLLWSWLYLAQGGSVSFQNVQFLQPARSFTARTDAFISTGKIPSSRGLRRHFGGNNFFSSSFSSSSHSSSSGASWNGEPEVFHHRSVQSFGGHRFGSPDFSNSFSSDPYLRTGIEAQRLTSHLYSKPLFFHNIPHVRGILSNQETRIKNGLSPHILGSLRTESPWNRYIDFPNFRGLNNGFRF